MTNISLKVVDGRVKILEQAGSLLPDDLWKRLVHQVMRVTEKYYNGTKPYSLEMQVDQRTADYVQEISKQLEFNCPDMSNIEDAYLDGYMQCLIDIRRNYGLTF